VSLSLFFLFEHPDGCQELPNAEKSLMQLPANLPPGDDGSKWGLNPMNACDEVFSPLISNEQG
jgi:hypothetical protein